MQQASFRIVMNKIPQQDVISYVGLDYTKQSTTTKPSKTLTKPQNPHSLLTIADQSARQFQLNLNSRLHIVHTMASYEVSLPLPSGFVPADRPHFHRKRTPILPKAGFARGTGATALDDRKQLINLTRTTLQQKISRSSYCETGWECCIKE